MTLAQFFPQKSFVTCCTRLLFLCGYGAQDYHQKKTKEKKKKAEFQVFNKIIIITCRLAKGVCIKLLALSIHQNIIHLVAALNVAYIIHHHHVWISEHGLSPETPKKGDEKLNHTFPFPTQQLQRGAGPPDPNCRSHHSSPPTPGHSVTYHPRENRF